jgi:hypothetical protein
LSINHSIIGHDQSPPDLIEILLRRLEFAIFQSGYSPPIEGLGFCRTGAILFKLSSQDMPPRGLPQDPG